MIRGPAPGAGGCMELQDGSRRNTASFMTQQASAKGMRVGFPLYPNVTLMDFAGATQVFSFAHFDSVWLAPNKEPIRTMEGVYVLPNETFDSHSPFDILFVPGGAPDGIELA